MIAAFFDMDRTLLRCNSGVEWIQFLRRRGEISTWHTLRALSWIARYKLSILDMEALSTVAAADVTGEPEQEMMDKARRWYDDEIRCQVTARGRQAIARHREAGHVIAILSSSTPYVTEPLARDLGIEHVLCTRLHIENGRFAGTHVRPTCYGHGKVHWAEDFAKTRDVDLDRSFFYTDSYSDLPMLLRVGERKVVNPDTRLRLHARRAGWDIEEW